MTTYTSPLQRWILESQQELLRRVGALQTAENSLRTKAASLLEK
jgi:hypothetical protein